MSATDRTVKGSPGTPTRPSVEERARGCLLGLGIGDALGAPAENLSRQQIRDRWGPVTDFLTDDVRGTDDSEYAAFLAALLIRRGDWLTPAHVEAAYREHVVPLAVQRGAGFSELGTVENLRRGWSTPASAAHLHPWSDGVAMRAAIYGVFAAGDPDEAARLVTIESSISASGEGVHGGVVVAAAVAALMGGSAMDAALDTALALVPPSSWTATAVTRVRGLADPDEVLASVVGERFPWTDLAPEAVALAAWAALQHPDDYAACVTGAVELGRDADTIAAIAGALVGARVGDAAIPAAWRDRLGPLTGRCLGEAVRGVRLDDLAERLVAARGVS
ncbi:ADP-ribosylglycohydrolase family protein [Mariniluteicoccus flavus]